MTAAPTLTLEDYLATEEASEVKREFVNGEIFAMAGAEPEHNAVREQLSAEVAIGLRGRRCQSFSADQRLLVTETDYYCYPDLVIACGFPEFVEPKPRSLVNPTVVMEVLSSSTESWDRGGKFGHYQRCPTLKIYALLNPAARRIEWYTRGEGGRWQYQTIEREGTWDLEAIGLTLDVAAIFSQLDRLSPQG